MIWLTWRQFRAQAVTAIAALAAFAAFLAQLSNLSPFGGPQNFRLLPAGANLASPGAAGWRSSSR